VSGRVPGRNDNDRLVRQDDGSGPPVKTVWAVAYGPGGQVPMMGPQGGSETISMQIVLIDDQSGASIRTYVRSAP
jgi:hypothetical protein